jgi:hypothetical protein
MPARIRSIPPPLPGRAQEERSIPTGFTRGYSPPPRRGLRQLTVKCSLHLGRPAPLGVNTIGNRPARLSPSQVDSLGEPASASGATRFKSVPSWVKRMPWRSRNS